MKSEFSKQEIILIEQVKTACFNAAKEAFYDASISGLCADGAIEAALGAIKMIQIKPEKQAVNF